jgi:hypothetical protein
MSFGDGGGFDGGGQDGGWDGGYDQGWDGGQQDQSAWASPYAAGTLDGFQQGSQVQEIVQQQIGPISDMVQSMVADRDADTLMQAHPFLTDESQAEYWVSRADQYAAELGVPFQQARSAKFIDMVIRSEMQAGAGGQQGYGGQAPGGYQQGEYNPDSDAIGQAILGAGGARPRFW